LIIAVALAQSAEEPDDIYKRRAEEPVTNDSPIKIA